MANTLRGHQRIAASLPKQVRPAPSPQPVTASNPVADQMRQRWSQQQGAANYTPSTTRGGYERILGATESPEQQRQLELDEYAERKVQAAYKQWHAQLHAEADDHDSHRDV